MIDDIATGYRRWADVETVGSSPILEGWARGVADSPELLARIAALPPVKRQPNLIFGAARWLGAESGSFADFEAWVLPRWADLVPVVMARSTQTNEAARCAVLLPALRLVDEPIALIEVGASAGLCLYPDRYSYRFVSDNDLIELDPEDGVSEVVISSEMDAAAAPSRLPNVVWRVGLDLAPLDVRDADDLRWLDALIWPEHEARRRRLRDAAGLIALDPPEIVAGDLIDDLPALIARAPADAHVVVMHTAVLMYPEPARRQRFVDLVRSMPDLTWISNEGEGVLPDIARQVDAPVGGRFIVAVDGRPIGLAGPHGQSYTALD